MRKRSHSREFALQVLYQIDITGDDLEQALTSFWKTQKDDPDSSVKEFADVLVKGTIANLAIIDQKVSERAKNWQLKRMAVVDRNIIRLASYELLFCPQTPAKVVINEAIELSKRFSDLEAAKFVNGILDKIKEEEV